MTFVLCLTASLAFGLGVIISACVARRKLAPLQRNVEKLTNDLAWKGRLLEASRAFGEAALRDSAHHGILPFAEEHRHVGILRDGNTISVPSKAYDPRTAPSDWREHVADDESLAIFVQREEHILLIRLGEVHLEDANTTWLEFQPRSLPKDVAAMWHDSARA